MQTEPEDVVGFLGSLDDLLQLVEDVAVQVAEQHPVDVQGVVAGEPGGGEQREDVFQWPQHSRWPLPERGGQRSGVLAETLQLWQLRGYRIGGTVDVVINGRLREASTAKRRR